MIKCEYGFYEVCPKSHAYCDSCADLIEAKRLYLEAMENNPFFRSILHHAQELSFEYNISKTKVTKNE